jgi:hypothetical protein
MDRDALFRTPLRAWGLDRDDLLDTVPTLAPGLRLAHFDYDVRPYRAARVSGDLPAKPRGRPTAIAVLATRGGRRHPHVLDGFSGSVLARCDGQRTVAQLADACRADHDRVRRVVEMLFSHGLIDLHRIEENAARPARAELSFSHKGRAPARATGV